MIEDKTFQNLDFTKETLPAREFEYCRFVGCQFVGTDVSNFRFVECNFDDCDLSNVKLVKTTLNDVRFKDCKLLGLHFENCSEFLFTIQFENCTLNFSSFYGRQLKKTVFKNCSLQEVDFTDADLSAAIFSNCELTKALFENTLLEKADFRTAFNYSIDPEKNKVRKARFDRSGLSGLLDKYDIEIS